MAGPADYLNFGLLDLNSNQITLSLDLDTSLQLFVYRYAETFSLAQLQTKLANQTLDQDAIDFGMTEPFSISSGSSATSQSLTVQLQRETLFLDSAVSGLTYSTGGTTATTNQDGLLYYFPSNPVSLSLGEIPLGNFTSPPAILSPYSVFDLDEGIPDDRVTNFARLLQSLDLDADPQNGIQLDSTEISNLNPNLDFSDNSSFAGLAVPAERALRHLANSLRLKNLGDLKPFTSIPSSNDDHASPSGLIGVIFDENLRTSTIQPNSLQLLDSNGSRITGHVFAERNWLLFEPDLDLPTYGDFTATVAQGLLTQTGRSLQADFSWSFSTADHPSSLFPRLIQLYPDNDSTSVSTNSVLSLTFDGPLFVGSQGIQWDLRLDNGSQLFCANSLQSISISCLPSTELTANDNFTITLLAGSLRSFEGLENDNISWRFKTGSGPSSGVASLQHLGEFHDNVSRDRLIGLVVGEGGSQYQLGQGESHVDNESQWRLPLFYP
ncbi:MAG: Ig-like domain-containing protein, partial [Deltaproteobacteria bacterium]